MSSEDWYRNAEWSDEIAAAFFARLRRSRKWNTAQYLRIQASYLAKRSPKVALDLIEKFFELEPDQTKIECVSAHLVRANAYIKLRDSKNALTSFEAAVEREREFPNVQTSAWSEYARFVVSNKLEQLYPRILEILDQHRGSALLLLKSEVFTWNASKALILARTEAQEDPVVFLKAALDAAQGDSGLRYHPTVGLVEDTDSLLAELLALKSQLK
jgi:hypothetical protein